MNHAFVFVSYASHLAMICDRCLNVGVGLLIAFGSEPFVDFPGRAACSFRAVVGVMVEASWVNDDRVDAWERSDAHCGVVVQMTGTENPIRFDLDAGEKFVRFVLVAMTLW